VREGLCFRPVSDSGMPIISRSEDISIKGGGGLYVASGHGPWGISLSLGTGFVMSEALQGKPLCVPVGDFALKEQIWTPRARL
jgi:glycine/D-amino acid oxidase-like deaminating enzyme